MTRSASRSSAGFSTVGESSLRFQSTRSTTSMASGSGSLTGAFRGIGSSVLSPTRSGAKRLRSVRPKRSSARMTAMPRPASHSIQEDEASSGVSVAIAAVVTFGDAEPASGPSSSMSGMAIVSFAAVATTELSTATVASIGCRSVVKSATTSAASSTTESTGSSDTARSGTTRSSGTSRSPGTAVSAGAVSTGGVVTTG